MKRTFRSSFDDLRSPSPHCPPLCEDDLFELLHRILVFPPTIPRVKDGHTCPTFTVTHQAHSTSLLLHHEAIVSAKRWSMTISWQAVLASDEQLYWHGICSRWSIFASRSHWSCTAKSAPTSTALLAGLHAHTLSRAHPHPSRGINAQRATWVFRENVPVCMCRGVHFPELPQEISIVLVVYCPGMVMAAHWYYILSVDHYWMTGSSWIQHWIVSHVHILHTILVHIQDGKRSKDINHVTN